MSASDKQLIEKQPLFPKGMFVLFYTEMWELFGRFGIIAVLVLYLTQVFHYTDGKAYSIFGGFLAMIYILPVLGGYLSDHYFSKYFAIVFGGLVMVLGNFLMIIPHETMVLYGLATVAIGSGFLLPNIPPLINALYRTHDNRRESGFTLYYVGKNIGALLGPVLCGLVAKVYGYNYAFVVSGIGMLTGLVVFIVGHNKLNLKKYQAEMVKPKHIKLYRGLFLAAMFLLIPVLYCILVWDVEGYFFAITLMFVIIYLYQVSKHKTLLEKKHLVAIIIAMIFVFIFYSFLNQGGTTLNLFIERIINRHLFGLELPSSFFYAINPIFMLMISPALVIAWAKIDKRKVEPIVLTKFAVAFIIFSLGFGIFTLAAKSALLAGTKVSAGYIVLSYFLFPLAELCMGPVALAFITSWAPLGLESMMIGLWMLSNAGASYFTGLISKQAQIPFALDTLTNFQQAAIIYQRLFLMCAAVLFITGIVAYFSRKAFSRLLEPAQSQL